MRYRFLYIFILILISCNQDSKHRYEDDPSSIEYYLNSNNVKLNIQLPDCEIESEKIEMLDLILIGKPKQTVLSTNISANNYYFQLDDFLTDELNAIKRWSECNDCLGRRTIAILADKQTPIELIKEIRMLFKDEGNVKIVLGCMNNLTEKIQYKLVR